MKIGIICNLNLVRSPLITSFLRKNFSNHDFFSSGISISSGLDFPANVNQLAKSWDLALVDSPNADLEQRSCQIEECDLLLCADDYVYEYCKVNILGKTLINLSQLARDYKVSISDPLNLEYREFRVVIAKYFFLVNVIMAKIENRNYLIKQIRPIDSKLISDSFDEIYEMARRLVRPLIIDYNLRVPNVRFLKNRDLKIESVENFLHSKFESSPSVIYSLNREIVNPELMYLDKAWRDELKSFTSSFDLILLLPPISINGVENHDSYLASLTF